MTTLAFRARAHSLWLLYAEALARRDRHGASAISKSIAADLGLTETQRTHNLPKIAKQTKAKGRPKRAPYEAVCPHCHHEIVIEVRP